MIDQAILNVKLKVFGCKVKPFRIELAFQTGSFYNNENVYSQWARKTTSAEIEYETFANPHDN